MGRSKKSPGSPVNLFSPLFSVSYTVIRYKETEGCYTRGREERRGKEGKEVTEGIFKTLKLKQVVPGSEKGRKIFGTIVVQMWLWTL